MNWLRSVKYFGSKYYHLAGAVDKLSELASKTKRCWFKGVGVSKELYISVN